MHKFPGKFPSKFPTFYTESYVHGTVTKKLVNPNYVQMYKLWYHHRSPSCQFDSYLTGQFSHLEHSNEHQKSPYRQAHPNMVVLDGHQSIQIE